MVLFYKRKKPRQLFPFKLKILTIVTTCVCFSSCVEIPTKSSVSHQNAAFKLDKIGLISARISQLENDDDISKLRRKLERKAQFSTDDNKAVESHSIVSFSENRGLPSGTIEWPKENNQRFQQDQRNYQTSESRHERHIGDEHSFRQSFQQGKFSNAALKYFDSQNENAFQVNFNPYMRQNYDQKEQYFDTNNQNQRNLEHQDKIVNYQDGEIREIYREPKKTLSHELLIEPGIILNKKLDHEDPNYYSQRPNINHNQEYSHPFLQPEYEYVYESPDYFYEKQPEYDNLNDSHSQQNAQFFGHSDTDAKEVLNLHTYSNSTEKPLGLKEDITFDVIKNPANQFLEGPQKENLENIQVNLSQNVPYNDRNPIFVAKNNKKTSDGKEILFNTEIFPNSNEKTSNISQKISKSRTMVPEHIKFFTEDKTLEYDLDSPEYEEQLYDEFIDTYYYQTNGTENIENNQNMVTRYEKFKNKNSTTASTMRPTYTEVTTETKLASSLSPIKSIPLSKSINTRSNTVSTHKPTTEESTINPLFQSTKSTTETTTKFLSAREKREKYKASQSPSGIISSTISLSEILQELGMPLPVFLGNLKAHGTSLKQFTAKLNEKSLSKVEFRRAKGDIEKLLNILEKPKPTVKNFNLQETLTTKSVSESSTVPPNLILSSTKNSQTLSTKQPFKPVVFGSVGRLPFSKSNNSPSSNKTVVQSSKIAIIAIANETGAGSFSILKNFKTMFNISESTTARAQRPGITTKFSKASNSDTNSSENLKPYIPKYRPYDVSTHEKGNYKIHRGIINSRLSSTARPTLRPPYVPRNIYPTYTTTTTQKSVPVDLSNIDEDSPDDTKKIFKSTKTKTGSREVSTRSAIMAACILVSVALSVFLAIFLVVKYKSNIHRNRRRSPIALPSDTSSSIPPIYATRSTYGKECYETSGFWTSLKKKFDPYSSPSSSPMSM